MLEDLSHAYDCVGHRVHTIDASEQTKHFDNCQVNPEWDYTYDDFGQLVAARGRGQLSSVPGAGTQLEAPTAKTGMNPVKGKLDGSKLYEYLETYKYDIVGNIKSMKHEAPSARSVTGWKRRYYYEESNPLVKTTDSSAGGGVASETREKRGSSSGDSSGSDDDDEDVEKQKLMGNRLSRTKVGSLEERHAYEGDAGRVGCMTKLPGYSVLEWNMDNLLGVSSTQNFPTETPEKTYYVYNYLGTRVRKVTESSAAAGSTPRKQKDTLYIGPVEIQARRLPGTSTEKSSTTVRWISRVSDEQSLALVETTAMSGERRR